MVEMTHHKDGNFFSISAKGHATGSDSVCAAISCLFTAVVWYYQYLRDDTNKVYLLEYRLDEGDSVVNWTDEDDKIYKMVVLALNGICGGYPEYAVIQQIP